MRLSYYIFAPEACRTPPGALRLSSCKEARQKASRKGAHYCPYTRNALRTPSDRRFQHKGAVFQQEVHPSLYTREQPQICILTNRRLQKQYRPERQNSLGFHSIPSSDLRCSTYWTVYFLKAPNHFAPNIKARHGARRIAMEPCGRMGCSVFLIGHFPL